MEFLGQRDGILGSEHIRLPVSLSIPFGDVLVIGKKLKIPHGVSSENADTVNVVK